MRLPSARFASERGSARTGEEKEEEKEEKGSMSRPYNAEERVNRSIELSR